ncbi:MAG: alkaline shock response membrane anchor protein AmaP [Bacillota bacterium]|nr:alkaline shock response membrane anchor protein AmaP [Bacillota bacterium]
MSGLRRAILIILALLLILAAALLVVCLINGAIAEDIVAFFEYNLVSGRSFWATAAVAAGLLLLGVFIFIIGVKTQAAPKQVRIFSCDGGSIDISLAAVDNVVKKAAAGVAGVKNVATELAVVNNGLVVGLNIGVPQDTPIPPTGNAVKQEVASQLEAIVGLVPAEIKVVVTSIVDKPQEVSAGGIG